MIKENRDIEGRIYTPIKFDGRDIMDKYLNRKKKVGYDRESALDDIIEHLALSDPKIQEIVKATKEAQTQSGEEFAKRFSSLPRIRQPRVDKVSTNALEFTDIELHTAIADRLTTNEVRLEPREADTPVPLDPRLFDPPVRDIIDYNTVKSYLIFPPYWAEPDIDPGEPLGNWIDWNSYGNTALCFAAAFGNGKSQERKVTNTARWEWDFSADITRQLDVDINFRLYGPCGWHKNSGGVVTVWVFSKLEVVKKPNSSKGEKREKTIAQTEMETSLLYSTNSTMAENGEPPQGYFGQPRGIEGVPFSPSDLRISVDEGEHYTIRADAAIALIANKNNAIFVGQMLFDKCKISGNCLLWKVWYAGLEPIE